MRFFNNPEFKRSSLRGLTGVNLLFVLSFRLVLRCSLTCWNQQHRRGIEEYFIRSPSARQFLGLCLETTLSGLIDRRVQFF
jgi:hypothetical protein